MDNALLILASGKSSRFGGFPKAFCTIDGEYIAQRTVDVTGTLFENVYLAVNEDIYAKYGQRITGCKTFAIHTGQGDAHSFLRAARFVKADCKAKFVTLCWGDTVYLDDTPFRKALEEAPRLGAKAVGSAVCAIDREPYAWFEVERDLIVESHFRSSDGIVAKGVHDQSVFMFDLDCICEQLEAYMRFLGLDDKEDYIDARASREMKLLEAFSYFQKHQLLPMKYALIAEGRSYSFNTQEELDSITGILES